VSSEFLKNRQTLHRYPTDFLLGDLLVKAGIIRQTELDEAVKLAGNKQVQVGQMLIMARHLTPAQLQVAVDAQSALRDRRIDMSAACKGIKFACKSGLNFSEAVSTQEVTASKLSPTNKLGELLLEAGLITPDEFAKALQRSQSTGLPLGRILVLNSSISDTILTTALEVQVRIRDQMLTRLEAIGCLRACATIGTTDETLESTSQVEAALKKPRRKGMRLGELFVMAGVLAEADVMNALELGLVNDQPMGQILVHQGFITTELLEAALKMQELVDQEALTANLAAETLNKIHHTGITLAEALNHQEIASPVSQMQIDFRELLSVARIAGEDEISSSFEIVLCNPPLLMQMLVSTGLLDERVAKSVLKCYTMMGEAYLSQEDAVVALDYCLQKFSDGASPEFSFEDALLELGWTFTPDQIENIPVVETTTTQHVILSPIRDMEVSEQIEKVFDFSVDSLLTVSDEEIADANRAAEITGDQIPVVSAPAPTASSAALIASMDTPVASAAALIASMEAPAENSAAPVASTTTQAENSATPVASAAALIASMDTPAESSATAVASMDTPAEHSATAVASMETPAEHSATAVASMDTPAEHSATAVASTTTSTLREAPS
jgi:hypothetical protein